MTFMCRTYLHDQFSVGNEVSQYSPRTHIVIILFVAANLICIQEHKMRLLLCRIRSGLEKQIVALCHACSHSF